MKGFCVSTIHTSEPVDDLKAVTLLSNKLLKLDMTGAPRDWTELDCESMRDVLLMAGGNYILAASYHYQWGGNLRGTVRKRKENGELQRYIVSVLPRNIFENLINQIGFI